MRTRVAREIKLLAVSLALFGVWLALAGAVVAVAAIGRDHLTLENVAFVGAVVVGTALMRIIFAPYLLDSAEKRDRQMNKPRDPT